MRISVVLCTAVLLFSTVLPAKSVSSSDSGDKKLIQQEMSMMGLYMYGLNQERAKAYPQLTRLQFFGDSMADIAQRLQYLKGSGVYHKNADELFKRTRALAISKSLNEAKENAKAIAETCGNCHGVELAKAN